MPLHTKLITEWLFKCSFRSEKVFRYPDADYKRPPVPKPDERPVIGLRTTKNLITANALANIHSAPKVPTRNVVDTRNGDKLLLEPSGLEPKYLHKKVNDLSCRGV